MLVLKHKESWTAPASNFYKNSTDDVIKISATNYLGAKKIILVHNFIRVVKIQKSRRTNKSQISFLTNLFDTTCQPVTSVP